MMNYKVKMSLFFLFITLFLICTANMVSAMSEDDNSTLVAISNDTGDVVAVSSNSEDNKLSVSNNENILTSDADYDDNGDGPCSGKYVENYQKSQKELHIDSAVYVDTEPLKIVKISKSKKITVKIKGSLTFKGRGISHEKMCIYVQGRKYKFFTDKKGKFSKKIRIKVKLPKKSKNYFVKVKYTNKNLRGFYEGVTVKVINKHKTSSKKKSKNYSYVGNSYSGKFHKSTCYWCKKMKHSHRVKFKSRKQAINWHYVPCKVCKP